MSNIAFDSVILAGGKQSALAPNLPNKNFIPINGRPLFIHVLHTLLQVERVGKIYIVGPREKIEEALGSPELPKIDKNRVRVMQESTNMVTNANNAFLDSIENYREGNEKSDRSIKEKPFFVITGDTPLTTPQEVGQFLEKCDMENYDYCVGMTPGRIMDHYRSGDDKTGIDFAYTNFAEDILRLNNMHLIKPFMIGNLMDIQKIYDMRHLRKVTTVIRSTIALLARKFVLRDGIDWAKMILAMFVRQAGFISLADYLKRNATMHKVEQVLGRLLSARARIVVTTYGGCAIDIDKKQNIKAIEDNYDDWIEHQRVLTEKPEEHLLGYQR